MTTTTAYAEIVKHERNAAGDLVVYGRATGPDLDIDRQICDAAWLAKAMPDWFRSGANVREQHSNLAAGVGQQLDATSDGGWDLSAVVVDPGSARKVELGVLKGYSIGIAGPKILKDAEAPGGRIVGGQIVEVSLVDRPANPTCTLTLAKAAKPGMQVKANQLDSARMLVKVEELAEPANLAVRDQVRELLVKASPDADIATAQGLIRGAAGLIVSEAQGLADGDMSELGDIETLVQAIDALRWFISCESREATEDMADIIVGLAAEPTTTTSAIPVTPGVVHPTAVINGQVVPPVEKAAGNELDPATLAVPVTPETPAPDAAPQQPDAENLTELVKAAVAEANTAHDAELKALRADLAKAMAQPVPGGPVLTRTAADQANADAHDARLTKAAHYRRMADETTDSNARVGYLQLAADLDAPA